VNRKKAPSWAISFAAILGRRTPSSWRTMRLEVRRDGERISHSCRHPDPVLPTLDFRATQTPFQQYLLDRSEN